MNVWQETLENYMLLGFGCEIVKYVSRSKKQVKIVFVRRAILRDGCEVSWTAGSWTRLFGVPISGIYI